ncbi:MAG: FAD/NAD(P)-binding protein [Spirochaetales bacterium]|nr:FAD/NAD(P)-binding protein [Spirochaetales bacterium]
MNTSVSERTAPAGRAGNPYIPYPVTIADVTVENEARDLKTFKLVFENEEDRAAFSYLPGQFAEVSVLGTGESPFGIASSPTEADYLLFTVKLTGTVTAELHASEVGRRIGVRGPLGNSFPWQRLEGKDIVIVSGGFAFTTLRSAITYMLTPENRKRFGNIFALYGARSPGELMYKEQLGAWGESKDIDLNLAVDREPGEPWDGKVGLVPNVLRELAPKAANAIALVCGPPIMIRFTIPVLQELGFAKEDIILSLENRMKCGIGKCGRCNVGAKYVCVDGPVFSFAELEKLPPEY